MCNLRYLLVSDPKNRSHNLPHLNDLIQNHPESSCMSRWMVAILSDILTDGNFHHSSLTLLQLVPACCSKFASQLLVHIIRGSLGTNNLTIYDWEAEKKKHLKFYINRANWFIYSLLACIFWLGWKQSGARYEISGRYVLCIPNILANLRGMDNPSNPGWTTTAKSSYRSYFSFVAWKKKMLFL